MKRPLQLVCLWHPASEAGKRYAMLLYDRFAERPGSIGLRIPVSLGVRHGQGLPPSTVDTEGAENTVVVVLTDAKMTQRVLGGTGDQWGDFVCRLLEQCSQGGLSVVLVALDNTAFDLDPRLERRSFVRLDSTDNQDLRDEELVFQTTVYALRRLRGDDSLPDRGRQTRAPISLFISHAKLDLDRSETGPVWALTEYLATNPVDAWYDQSKIDAGAFFDQAITDGVAASAVVVAVLTDNYTNRQWCRTEVLLAKGCGVPGEPKPVPIVVVDALKHGEARSFPYLGNHPTIRWKGGGRSEAQRIVNTALGEALRFNHNMLLLRRKLDVGDCALAAAPELLTVTCLPREIRRVYYPDPPIGSEELALLEQARPGVLFTTLLSEIARRAEGRKAETVAVSLSGSTDIDMWGASESHLATFASDLFTLLLVAGRGLTYGGMIGHEGRHDRDYDFMSQLLGLVKSYSKSTSKRAGLVVNYVAWPIHLKFSAEELGRYGTWAKLNPLPKPAMPPAVDAALAPDERGWFPPDTPERRYAWARGMTELREAMVADPTIGARIAVGGKLLNYAGRYPGIIEEALLTLRARRPLFLLGAFGGATRLTIDALKGTPREELTTPWVRNHIAQFAQLMSMHQEADVEMLEPERLAAELCSFGRDGVALALGNGLDDAENEELFLSTDPMRLVELILGGLARLQHKT